MSGYDSGLVSLEGQSLFTLSEQKKRRLDVEEETHQKVSGFKAKDLRGEDKVQYSSAVERVNQTFKELCHGSGGTLDYNSGVAEAWTFFESNKTRIDQARTRIQEYPTDSTDIQQTTNLECKRLFHDFRQVCGQDYVLKDKVETSIKVDSSDVAGLNGMIGDMKKQLSFEGKPAASDRTQIRQKRMSNTLRDTVQNYLDSGIWDDGAVRYEDISKFLKVDAIVTGSEDYIEDLKAGAEDFANDYPNGVHSSIAAKCDLAKVMLSTEETGQVSFNHQDANIDRLFHFLYLIWVSHRKVPNKKSFDMCCKMLNAFGGIITKQTSVIALCKGSGHPLLTNIRFDEQAGGGSLHKFQHPMMISVKRWSNGAACFSRIRSLGQLLNTFSDRSGAVSRMIALDKAIKNEHDIVITKAGLDADETTVYNRTRVTLWAVHSLLKGTTTCNNWAGMVTGNALDVVVSSE